MKVFVYYNLHKSCWSVRASDGPLKGKVIAHAGSVFLRDATFKVSEAGRQRVLKEQRKNVHAGVEGELTGLYEIQKLRYEFEVPQSFMLYATNEEYGRGYVSYNPYRGPHFYQKGRDLDVHKADLVNLRTDRRVYARHITYHPKYAAA